MSARIALIGNSHLAAFRSAWDAWNTDRGVNADWFAAPDNRFADFELSGTVIAPTDPTDAAFFQQVSSYPSLDVADYDGFILVGLHLRLMAIAEQYRTHRLPEHAGPKHLLVTPATWRETVLAQMRSTASYRTAEMLRRVTAVPIFLTPDPLLSVAARAREVVGVLMPQELASFIHGSYAVGMQTIAEELGATVVVQPPALVTEIAFTPVRYASRSSVFFSSKGRTYGEDEVRHMGAEFGTVMLDQIVPSLLDRIGAVAAESRHRAVLAGGS